jgi:uncharacterized protein (DUF58 family)
MASTALTSEHGWQSGIGPTRRWFSWRRLFWLMVFPPSGQRTGLTVAGAMLILFSVAIGVAAYNSSNNILFLTLSLLMGCLILSGVLSWMNFRGLAWRLELEPSLRVGVEHTVALGVRNEKRWLPTYSLAFELELTQNELNLPVTLTGRLDGSRETRLITTVRPARRGADFLRLVGVSSAFPFGFLRKTIPAFAERSVIIWPAIIEYRRLNSAVWERSSQGETQRRFGQSGDLLAVRRYQSGDALRQMHWKATARVRQFMVKQNAAESGESFALWVDVSSERWGSASEQFERLCSFAASLGEDLFKLGRLRAVAVGDDAWRPIHQSRDLEFFLDRLALAQLTTKENHDRVSVTDFQRRGDRSRLRNVIAFRSEGAHGISAYVNGERTATT